MNGLSKKEKQSLEEACNICSACADYYIRDDGSPYHKELFPPNDEHWSQKAISLAYDARMHILYCVDIEGDEINQWLEAEAYLRKWTYDR